MKKNKFFTSPRAKNGIYTTVDGKTLTISMWEKKPDSTVKLNKKDALELCNFILSGVDDSESKENKADDQKIQKWSNLIADFKNRPNPETLKDEDNA